MSDAEAAPSRLKSIEDYQRLTERFSTTVVIESTEQQVTLLARRTPTPSQLRAAARMLGVPPPVSEPPAAYRFVPRQRTAPRRRGAGRPRARRVASSRDGPGDSSGESDLPPHARLSRAIRRSRFERVPGSVAVRLVYRPRGSPRGSGASMSADDDPASRLP
jgi:hypothetical protein